MTSLEMPLAPLANVAGVAARRVAETNRVAECFFHEQADAIASTCQHLA